MTTTSFQPELDDLLSKDLFRQMRTFTDVEGIYAKLNGQKIVLFCGNDYLGLSRHPRVKKAAAKAIEQYGVGSGAARLVSGSTSVHAELEKMIAESKGKESALLFSTGYLANLGILTALAGEKDLIVLDKLCHASIIDGARLSGATLRVFPHKNYEKARHLLENASGFQRKLIVTDSVFSMDGDLADLKTLVEIKEKHDALLIIDDAHGTGVLGQRGHGAAEDEKLESRIDIIMGTLSKGIGCLGGFAAASREITEYLVNFSRPFIFATSLPPAICAAALEAFCVIEEEPEVRQRLWQNIQKTHALVTEAGFDPGPICSPIFPLIVGDEKKALELSGTLQEQGIFIPAIRYPSVPKGKARLRLTISAAHRDEDLKKLASLCLWKTAS